MQIRYEIREAWREQAFGIEPNIAITLGMGLPTTAERLNTDATEFLNQIQRRALGPRWSKKPASIRINAVGFHEHPLSNPHMHIAAAAGDRVAERIVLDGSRYWKAIRPAGDFWAQRIENLDGYIAYITKDAITQQAWDDVFVYASRDL